MISGCCCQGFSRVQILKVGRLSSFASDEAPSHIVFIPHELTKQVWVY